MKIAIIGRTEILYDTALKLHEAGHEISCIITSKAAPEYQRGEKDFSALAGKLKARFFLTKSLDGQEIKEVLNRCDIGVSINWPEMIGKETLALFRLGILNGHLGDLPRYRGNAVVAWALLSGEKEIFATLHFMESDNLDCGHIVAQRPMKVDNDTTIGEVLSWSRKAFPELYVEALQALSSDDQFSIKYADVKAEDSFRCYPRLPEDGLIDWNLPAVRVHDLIRVSSEPYQGAYTYQVIKNSLHKLYILKSRVVTHRTNDLAVAGHLLMNDQDSGESQIRCGEGVLALLLCRYDGESECFMPGRRWRSIRKRLGIKPEDMIWQNYSHDNSK